MDCNEERIYTFLGFAQKAGKLASGENTVEAKVKERSAVLVMVAVDAPDHTKAKMAALAQKFHKEYIEYGEKVRIGQAIGKSPRNVLLISDKKFAAQINKNAE